MKIEIFFNFFCTNFIQAGYIKIQGINAFAPINEQKIIFWNFSLHSTFVLNDPKQHAIRLELQCLYESDYEPHINGTEYLDKG